MAALKAATKQRVASCSTQCPDLVPGSQIRETGGEIIRVALVMKSNPILKL